MNDFFVHRDAKARGKPSITFESGLRFLLQGQVLRDFVHVRGGCALANILTELQKDLRDDFTRALHAFDFSGTLQMNHH